MDEFGNAENTKLNNPQKDFTKLSPVGLGIGACAFVVLVLAMAAPKDPVQQITKAAVAQKSLLPVDYNISVTAKQVLEMAVEMEIATNLPLPVEVMVGITMDGLKDEDTWVGYNERITLISPNTTHRLDISKARKPLPNTSYIAEVSFYPKWGATRNNKALDAPKLNATSKLDLKTEGSPTVSTASVNQQSERRKWVMENVNMRMSWNERMFVAKLGQYDKSPASMSPLHDAYYFPKADMTLVVNRVRNEVTIWRDGRNSN